MSDKLMEMFGGDFIFLNPLDNACATLADYNAAYDITDNAIEPWVVGATIATDQLFCGMPTLYFDGEDSQDYMRIIEGSLDRLRTLFNPLAFTMITCAKIDNKDVWKDSVRRGHHSFKWDLDNWFFVRKSTPYNLLQAMYTSHGVNYEHTASIDTRDWFMTVVTFDLLADEFSFYVNDKLIGTHRGIKAWPPGEIPWVYLGFEGNSWYGWLSTIGLMSRALTQQEVIDVYGLISG